MNQLSELKRRERLLRTRMGEARPGEFGAQPSDRRFVRTNLAIMRALVRQHLAELPVQERRFEEYRLDFILPLYTYLNRAYEVYYDELVEARR